MKTDSTPSPGTGVDSHTVLIVDDVIERRKAIASDFQEKGFFVLTAARGTEALQLLTANDISLVVTDARLQDGSGIDLLERIKEKDVSLPVFVFMERSSENDVSSEDAYGRGAEAVFSKPFDREELFEAVTQALLPVESRFERMFPRLGMESPVGVKFLKSNFSAKTETFNLGRGGMFIALKEKFPERNEEMEFRLEVTYQSRFEVKGRGIVRWVRKEAAPDGPAGCGIEFTTLDPATAEKIVKLTRRIKAKSFIPRK